MTLEEFIKECESLRDDFTWSNQKYIIRGVRKDHKDSYCPLTALCYKKIGKDLPKCLYSKAADLLGLSDVKGEILRAADNPQSENLSLRNQLYIALGITK